MIRHSLRLLVPVMVCSLLASAQAQQIEPIKEISSDGLVLHLQDPFLYVGETGGFKIFDIGNGADPVLVGQMETPYPVTAIGLVDNVAILGQESLDDQRNLLIVDITNKANPATIRQRHAGEVRQLVKAIYPIGRTVYIGVEDGGIFSTSLTAENDLAAISNLTLESTITNLTANGTTAYISTWDYVYSVDLADPNNMQILDSEFSNSFNNDLDLDGNRLFVAEGTEGLTIYDVTNPSDIQKVRTDSTVKGRDIELSAIDFRQQYAYVGTFFYSSRDVTAPDIPGDLRIWDYENFNSPSLVGSYSTLEHNVLDVVAHNGYVYMIGDGTLKVFRHGPTGEVRPTSTPIVNTPTVTPTITPTATITPPIIPTATRPQGGDPSPTPTATFTVPAGSSPTPTLPAGVTATPIPQATSTPGAMTPLFSADFTGPNLADEQFAVQLPFSGTYTLGTAMLVPIPTNGSFPGATDGKGLMVTLQPNQAVMIWNPSPIAITDRSPLLFRVNVQSSGPGAAVALAALDGSFNGSVATNQSTDSAVLTASYKRLTMIYKPPSNTVAPILQVVATGNQAVVVYIDNFEIYALRSGTSLPVDMLGADGTAP